MIEKPGTYDLDDATYHSDPAPTPSFSAGIGKILLLGTPMHGASAHPRLTVPEDVGEGEDDEEEDASGKFDIGTASHAIHTGKGAEIVEIESFTADGTPSKTKGTKAWKEGAAAARAAGKTPLSPTEAARCRRLVARSRVQLVESFGYDPFGEPENNELALFWKHKNRTWCRAKADALDLDHKIAWDLKTTPGYADPQSWPEQQDRANYIAMRAAHYLEGLGQIFGPGWRYRFWVVETKRPHCAVAVELPESWIDRGAEQRDVALREFEHCLALGKWKGWARGVVTPEDPSYAETRWLNRRDSRPTEAARELAKLAQAPERMR